MYRQVAEFHRAFNLPHPSSPVFPDADTRKLRSNLLIEEWEELLSAEGDDNLKEIADALADICYIAAGTLVAYGIVPEGDAMVFSPVSQPRLPTKRDRAAHLDMLESCLNQYELAEGRDDLDHVLAALKMLMMQSSLMAACYGIPHQTVFDEVHRSNMAKLGPHGKPIYRSDGKVLKPEGWEPPNIARVLREATK